MTAKDITLNRFKERIENGKSIKYNDMNEDDPSLLHAITRYFGGIMKISKELGIGEDELVGTYGLTRNINRRTLTKEEILNRLLYLKSIGKLSTNSMRKEFSDLRLEISIKKTFGSVKEGLEYFSLERDTVTVTKNSIIKEIKEMESRGIDLSYKNAINLNSKLVSNATNKFGKGWHSILDDIGVDYVSKNKKLTKENVMIRINNIIEKEGNINYYLLSKYDSSILFYAYENYGNIIDFYLDMSIDPNECMDFSKQTIKGFQLERAYAKLLDTLNIDYIYNNESKQIKGLRPDFQLSRNTWLDCKLSSWTKSIEDTIQKYTPHCDKLVIVFLRGEYRYLPDISNEKVEFKKVSEYYPYLRQINRHDLIEEFENILKYDDFSESVTTERLIS